MLKPIILCLPLMGAAHATTPFSEMARYKPKSLVTGYAALDRDLAVMINHMETNQSHVAFHNAQEMYEYGAHSMPYAELMLTGLTEADGYDFKDYISGPIHVPNNETSVVTGVLMDDIDWESGDSPIIRVAYDLSRDQEDYVGCQVGSLWLMKEANLDGCFTDSGELTITPYGTNESWSFNYEYLHNIRESNLNDHSLADLTRQAARTMRMCSDNDRTCTEKFFDDFAIFEEYYGEADFGDKWVEALFNYEHTRMTSGWGDADFSIFRAHEDRHKRYNGVHYAITTLVVMQQVIRELEMSVLECRQGAHHTALHHLDKAVAYYVGSLEGPIGEGQGVFMFALASEACGEFKTCDNNSVNSEIMTLFSESINVLEAENCATMELNKNDIVKSMRIPLIQKMLRAAHEGEYGDSGILTALEGATFTAAILPWLDNCDESTADDIYDAMSLRKDYKHMDFAAVKSGMESLYQCLGLKCAQIGGIINGGTLQYYPEATPCSDPSLRGGSEDDPKDLERPPVTTSVEENSKSAGQFVGIILASLAGIVLLIVVVRRMRRSSQNGNGRQEVSNLNLSAVTEIS